MITHEIQDLLNEHPFFADLPPDDMTLITGCASLRVAKRGTHLAHEGMPANNFFIIRKGKLRVEHPAPTGPSHVVQTLGPGQVVGWSWLFPPHIWAFDVVALEDTHLVALDGTCLRGKCEKNHSLGYRLMKKFANVLRQRLRAASLHVMDVYAPAEER